MAAQWRRHREKKRQWRRCSRCCVEGGWGGELLLFWKDGGFRSGRPTWHLQLSLRGPWLLRLIRLPERTIGVRCRTLVWIQPSFSNWIRSLSGSHGLVLRRGGRETQRVTMRRHGEGKIVRPEVGERREIHKMTKTKMCMKMKRENRDR